MNSRKHLDEDVPNNIISDDFNDLVARLTLFKLNTFCKEELERVISVLQFELWDRDNQGYNNE